MAVDGAIAERTRAVLPVTWDALSGDPRFGDGLLRSIVDTTKERITGVNISPASESSYPLIVIDYIAKVAAIELITPGIDFWMNQPSSESATGTEEVHTFVDRAEALRLLRADLIAETRKILPEVEGLINFTRVRRGPRARINTMDDEFLTPSPQEFPRPYIATDRS